MAASQENVATRTDRRGSAWVRSLTPRLTRDQLVDIALLLFALLAAALILESFGAALRGSRDNDWGAARVLLGGSDPYKLYLACAPCRRAPFLPAVGPMYPASRLVLFLP